MSETGHCKIRVRRNGVHSGPGALGLKGEKQCVRRVPSGLEYTSWGAEHLEVVFRVGVERGAKNGSTHTWRGTQSGQVF